MKIIASAARSDARLESPAPTLERMKTLQDSLRVFHEQALQLQTDWRRELDVRWEAVRAECKKQIEADLMSQCIEPLQKQLAAQAESLNKYFRQNEKILEEMVKYFSKATAAPAKASLVVPRPAPAMEPAAVAPAAAPASRAAEALLPAPAPPLTPAGRGSRFWTYLNKPVFKSSPENSSSSCPKG